jgi:hypothetical protein
MAARAGIAAPARSLAFDLRFGERRHGRKRGAHAIVEFRRRSVEEARNEYEMSLCVDVGFIDSSRALARRDDAHDQPAQTEGDATEDEAERGELGHGSAETGARNEDLPNRSRFHANDAAAESGDDRYADQGAEGTR